MLETVREGTLLFLYIYKLVCIWVGIDMVVLFIVIKLHQTLWKENWVFALVYLLKDVHREVCAL